MKTIIKRIKNKNYMGKKSKNDLPVKKQKNPNCKKIHVLKLKKIVHSKIRKKNITRVKNQT